MVLFPPLMFLEFLFRQYQNIENFFRVRPTDRHCHKTLAFFFGAFIIFTDVDFLNGETETKF